MRDVEVAIVVTPREWAERLHRFAADHGGARVRARILDPREALDDGDGYEVLVVDDLTSYLSARFVGDVHRLGRRVLGVYDPEEPWGRERLVEAGVDVTVPATTEPEDAVRLVRELAEHVRSGERDTVEAAPTSADGGAVPDSVERGRVIAVAGASGGTGATEVAIGLTVALDAMSDSPAVLVDADTSHPALAQRLDLPAHPNLRTAIDAVEHRAGALADALTVVSARGSAVLVGLPNAAAWPEVRPDEVGAVLEALSSEFGSIVVDAGTTAEELPTALSIGRHDVARAVLTQADAIVAVSAPTPLGVTRLLGWLSRLRDLTRLAPLVAVNRAPADRYVRAEIEDEVVRSATLAGIGFVPDDRAVAEAVWEGQPVRGAAFARAMESLAHAVSAMPVRAPVAAP